MLLCYVRITFYSFLLSRVVLATLVFPEMLDLMENL